jgi:energy-coupling factor transporter ATP-binding protein EcfA2
MRFNPFTPGNPLRDAGLLAGRDQELRLGVQFRLQITSGNPRHYLITGPRGIGKSTIALAFAGIAHSERQYLSLVPGATATAPLLVAGHVAQSGETMGDVVAGLAERVQQQTSGVRGIQLDTIELRALVASMTFSRPAEQGSVILRFVRTLAKVLADIRAGLPGILLYADELDTIADQASVASFLKVLVEELSTEGVRNVGLMVIGQDGLASQLSSHHASSVRLFQQVHLSPLSDGEVRDLIQTALDSSGVVIDDAALDAIVQASQGLPARAQLIGYETFDGAGRIPGDSIDANVVASAVADIQRRGEWS